MKGQACNTCAILQCNYSDKNIFFRNVTSTEELMLDESDILQRCIKRILSTLHFAVLFY